MEAIRPPCLLLPLLSILIFAVWPCHSTSEVLPQPYLRDIDVLQNCCCYQQSGYEEELLACANASAYRTFDAYLEDSLRRKITFVSYSTTNIFGYGAFSLAINTAFAQHHRLGLRLLTHNDGANYEPRDPRWNKVQILLQELELQGGRRDGRGEEYAVWLDSDLVFLDFSLRFDDIISQYPSADVILSADPEPANGVANTGCIIVRNTLWARSFLRRWWHRFDRAQGMDQHAFTKLWEEEGGRQTRGDISQHVKILPMHVLNSHIPAWTYQLPQHRVLHLAGASNLFRAAVFQQGMGALCDSYRSQDYLSQQSQSQQEPVQVQENRLPVQLGLHRDQLRHLMTHLPASEVLASLILSMDRLVSMDSVHCAANSGSSSDTHRDSCGTRSEVEFPPTLHDVKQRFYSLQDLLQEGVDSTPLRSPEVRRGLLRAMRWVYSATMMAAAPTLSSSSSSSSDSSPLEAVQAVLDSFFNYIVLFQQLDRQEFLQSGVAEFEFAAIWVERLMGLVGEGERGAALYYSFKILEMKAMLHKQRGEVMMLLETSALAVDVWKEMHQLKQYGSGNGVMHPFAEIQGILLNIMAFSCPPPPPVHKDKEHVADWEKFVQLSVQKGLKAAEQSLTFFDQSWGSMLAQQQHSGPSVPPGVPRGEQEDQAVRLYYAGRCASAAGLLEQSKSWLEGSLLMSASVLQLAHQGTEEQEVARSLMSAVEDQLRQLDIMQSTSSTSPTKVPTTTANSKKKYFRRRKK